MRYNVQFDLKGVATNKYVEASAPGAAFHQILKKYPDCVLVRATVSRTLAGSAMWIDFFPPPNLRKVSICQVEQEKLEQTEMEL